MRRGRGRTAFGLAAIDSEGGDPDGAHGVDGLGGGEAGAGMD